MLKNSQRQAIMYMALGAAITIVILNAMGRLRMERYEEPASDAELEKLLGALAEGEPAGEEEPAVMGPSSD